MKHRARRGAAVILLAPVIALWTSCTDLDTGVPTGPVIQPQFSSVRAAHGLEQALAAQEKHTEALLNIRGVVGTAVGLLPDGTAAVQVYITAAGLPGVPTSLDGVPVDTHVSGFFVAHSDPTLRARPAPLGYSVGHPAITAGTIGARVIDGAGNRYILSNNHVLADINRAGIGDPILQPGPFDGGTSTDQVGTLTSFVPLDFKRNGRNTVDAAIALTTAGEVGHATPADDGYGAPSTTLWGDANGDGNFDNRNALLGLNVIKYGRTTQQTAGQITGINASVSVCYEGFIFCTKIANFVDQIIITPGNFSAGGDSGSLIVSANGHNPVGLLYAGSSSQTIANRIDIVLNEFNVSIDGGSEPPPPTPVTDVEIASVSAPASATQGDDVTVVVNVRNAGTEDVGSFDVTLADQTDGNPIGTQTVSGLGAGADTDVSFSWDTDAATTGAHTLLASHDLSDDNGANDSRSTGVTLNPAGSGSGMHVGDLDALVFNDGRTWSVAVEVAIHDANHQPLNGVTVQGAWTPDGLGSDTCTTGELGGNGTCIFLLTGIPKKTGSVSFTVQSATHSVEIYAPADNHDPDGDSNGTVITVLKS